MKEDFTTLSELQGFIDGLKDTENSKVYFKVEQIDGYNNLCIYLDNKNQKAEQLNGFKKFYQLKMNKVS